ncbi:MAG: hypothetical protein ACPGXK_12690 [Phycisphaerae bacterium]
MPLSFLVVNSPHTSASLAGGALSTSSEPAWVSSFVSALDERTPVCEDVYSATAMLFGGEVSWPDVVVVCVSGLPVSALEFFSLLRNRDSNVRLYAYGDARHADLVSLAIDHGADGELTSSVCAALLAAEGPAPAGCVESVGDDGSSGSVESVGDDGADGGSVAHTVDTGLEARLLAELDGSGVDDGSAVGMDSGVPVGSADATGLSMGDGESGDASTLTEADIRRDDDISYPVRVPWSTGDDSSDSPVDAGMPRPLRIAPGSRPRMPDAGGDAFAGGDGIAGGEEADGGHGVAGGEPLLTQAELNALLRDDDVLDDDALLSGGAGAIDSGPVDSGAGHSGAGHSGVGGLSGHVSDGDGDGDSSAGDSAGGGSQVGNEVDEVWWRQAMEDESQ